MKLTDRIKTFFATRKTIVWLKKIRDNETAQLNELISGARFREDS